MSARCRCRASTTHTRWDSGKRCRGRWHAWRWRLHRDLGGKWGVHRPCLGVAPSTQQPTRCAKARVRTWSEPKCNTCLAPATSVPQRSCHRCYACPPTAQTAAPCCCPAALEGVPLTTATVTRFSGEGYLYAGRPGFGAKGPPEESSTEGCGGCDGQGCNTWVPGERARGFWRQCGDWVSPGFAVG